MTQKESLYYAGYSLLKDFCQRNQIQPPGVIRLKKTDRLFHLATCAFYRPYEIKIMVEKCASPGMGGRAWSWPGYVIDRTPYGVLQHELGHHVDTVKTGAVTRENLLSKLFSRQVWTESKEPPLTGYLGTDKEDHTFYMEWFAEHFRLYVTNSDLCRILRPRFYNAMWDSLILPTKPRQPWRVVLESLKATPRILDQAQKKIDAANKGK